MTATGGAREEEGAFGTARERTPSRETNHTGTWPQKPGARTCCSRSERHAGDNIQSIDTVLGQSRPSQLWVQFFKFFFLLRLPTPFLVPFSELRQEEVSGLGWVGGNWTHSLASFHVPDSRGGWGFLTGHQGQHKHFWK